MDLEEATEDTVVKDLPKLVMAMVVVSVDTEDMVVTEDMVQKEAMEDTVARDLLMPATATGVTEGDTEVSEEVMQEDTEVSEVSEEDTEEVMEVTMVDMDTEGKFCAQHPFDSPEPSSFIMPVF